jgi:hypothetical protein
MASNINTTDIDTEYPVPGQDNDSQGFRDNFTTILDNFEAAKSEIETLQTDTVKLNAENTFLLDGNDNPTLLIDANLKAHSLTVYTDPAGSVSSATTVSYADGEYQVYDLDGDTEVTIDNSGWPQSGRYAKMTLHLTASTPSVLTIAGNIKYGGDAFWNNPVIDSSSDPHIIELWTYQGGTTIYAKYLGKFE